MEKMATMLGKVAVDIAKRTCVTPLANSLEVNLVGVVMASLQATQFVPSKIYGMY